jgi:hypothetical protein
MEMVLRLGIFFLEMKQVIILIKYQKCRWIFVWQILRAESVIWLNVSLEIFLQKRKSGRNVVTVVTQVVVDENDPAFENPTKPVGAFYLKEEAELLAKSK